jgi:hypothetical protein
VTETVGAKPANEVTTDFGVELAHLIDLLGDSVPKPLGFSALQPEWLTDGAAGRRPAIPAPGSALGSHPCVGRGRDASCPAPPAQIPTCELPAWGSYLG